MADLIDREAALELGYWHGKRPDIGNPYGDGVDAVDTADIEALPAVDAVEVSADELKYLINDTIAYIWRMEDSGRDKSEFGYDERKALLEKLKRFKKEHFPEMRCCVERREENAAD